MSLALEVAQLGLLILAGSFLGHFLIGLLDAEALGIRLADWLRNKLKK